MKILALIAVALLFVDPLQADETVSRIRREYKTIRDALPTLNKEEIDLSGYSVEGGEATAYRDAKGNIRLIRIGLYGESGKVFQEFYYQNGLLFFAFYESHGYNVPYYMTQELAENAGSISFDPKKTEIIEDRYYFEKQKMVRWQKGNEIREVSIPTKEFKQAAWVESWSLTENEVKEFSSEILAKFE